MFEFSQPFKWLEMKRKYLRRVATHEFRGGSSGVANATPIVFVAGTSP
jgi:hypothetical protein